MNIRQKKNIFGIILVFCIGLITLVGNLYYLYASQQNIFSLFFGILVPIGLSLILLFGGFFYTRKNMYRKFCFQIGLWCLAGFIFFMADAIALIMHQTSRGVIIQHIPHFVLDTGIFGANIGLIIGIIYSEKDIQQKKSENLAKRLTILNRILRHDIKNNVNIITLKIEEAIKKHERNGILRETKQKLEELHELSENARMIEKTLSKQNTKPETIDIIDIIEKEMKKIKRDYPEAKITYNLPEQQNVYAIPIIDSAIHNILQNAIQHNDKKTPEINITTKKDTKYIFIEFQDNGPGIRKENIEILNKGFETQLKHLESLGLWIVNWIIEQSNGKIKYKHNKQNGTTVTLKLQKTTYDIH